MRFPGWNSTKAVERTHVALEALGLISFALAVGFEFAGMTKSSNVGWSLLVTLEILAFVYGRRETRLSALETERLTARIQELSTARRLTEDQVAVLRQLLT